MARIGYDACAVGHADIILEPRRVETHRELWSSGG